MLPRRKWLISLGVVLVVALVCTAVGLAIRLRSDYYRSSVEAMLSNRLGMDVKIGAIQALALSEQRLEDVHAYMHGQGQEVFSCAEAVWKTDSSREPVGRTLELRDGWLLVGAARWSQDEYTRLLSSGLGHDFAALGLSEVLLRGIDLRFHHSSMTLAAESTSGMVLFDQDGDGRASLQCLRLNGVDVSEPVHLMFRFTPGEHLVFHEIRLTVPRIPVDALGLDGLLEDDLSCGRFEGTIAYSRLANEESVEITGSLHDADLLEFTGGIPGGPYHGAIDVQLDTVVLRERRLQSLTGRGRVSDLQLGEMLPELVSPSSEGRLVLDIDRIQWQEGRVAELKAEANCEALSLDALSALWGEGVVTGSLTVDLSSLSIVDDELQQAELTIVARPPDDGPGLLDGDIVARAAKQWFDVDLGTMLPEQFEYTELGVRFVVADGRLHVFGTHGTDGRTILSINVFGRPLGVIRQPERTFPVPDIMGVIRRQVEEVPPDKVRTWWEHLRLQKKPPE